jgi:1,4-dihydroxy-2-naphthoyl-CoA hydrolase
MPLFPQDSPADRQPGFESLLGLSFDEVGPDGVTISTEVRPELLQPYGIVHGGVWCSLVETAASVAGAHWYGERGRVVGVANHTDFLRAIGEGPVAAVASPIHRGRLQQLWLVEIRDGSGRMVARGEVRLQNLPAES